MICQGVSALLEVKAGSAPEADTFGHVHDVSTHSTLTNLLGFGVSSASQVICVTDVGVTGNTTEVTTQNRIRAIM